MKKFQETKGELTFKELDTFLKDKIGLESIRTNNKAQTPQVLYSEELSNDWGKLKLK